MVFRWQKVGIDGHLSVWKQAARKGLSDARRVGDA
jgi:hypothetical protein